MPYAAYMKAKPVCVCVCVCVCVFEGGGGEVTMAMRRIDYNFKKLENAGPDFLKFPLFPQNILITS